MPKLASLLLLFFLAASKAWAGYTTNTVRLDLSPGRPVASITITADSDATVPTLLQVTASRWKQVDGKNLNDDPASEIIISPPFMKIAPGQSQLVRIALRKPAIAGMEAAYRISLKEVTPRNSAMRGVQFRLSMNIPLFVTPSAPVFGADAGLRRMGNGAIGIAVHNTGNIHVHVLGVTVSTPQGKRVAFINRPFYVLAQQTVVVPLLNDGGAVAAGSYHVSVNTDRAPIKADVNLS